MLNLCKKKVRIYLGSKVSFVDENVGQQPIRNKLEEPKGKTSFRYSLMTLISKTIFRKRKSVRTSDRKIRSDFKLETKREAEDKASAFFAPDLSTKTLDEQGKI